MSFADKVDRWTEDRRLKKLKRNVAKFMEIYSAIKGRMAHLHSLLKYIDNILEAQEKAVKAAKQRGKNGQDLR